jgi:hypothetical protein
MITELDVHRTARQLVEKHGDNAMFMATEEAEKLRRQGDAANAAQWERIARAVAAAKGTQTEGPIG